jgi:SP family sugar:H+ symporter-like MFS transporter
MAPTAAKKHIENLPFVILIVGIATIGGFMFGYDSGVINGTQAGLESSFNLSKFGEGLTVSALLFGCAVGAFSAGRLSDIWGRRRVLIAAALAFIVSAIGAGGAPDATIFFIARFLGGLGVGAASVMTPAYISEVTPAAIRGRLSTIQQVMIITGLTGAFLVNYILAASAGVSTAPFWMGAAAWRWMFWMQAIPGTIFFLSLLFIPESPRYLVANGKDAEAEGVLTKVVGADEARRKISEIRASIASDHKPKLADLIDKATGRWRRIVWVGIGLATFQQLVGINVVFYYGATLWQAVGFTEADSLKINILTGSLSIAGCIVILFLIDKIGRKPLLFWGSVAMALALGTVTWAFSTGTMGANNQLQLTSSTGVIALVAALFYSLAFNMSWGPVMWVMLGEMFPNQMRGSALAVSGAAQWISNFAISASFPWLAANVGLTPTYAFYAACAFISVIFVAKMVHETSGLELEQMQG